MNDTYYAILTDDESAMVGQHWKHGYYKDDRSSLCNLAFKEFSTGSVPVFIVDHLYETPEMVALMLQGKVISVCSSVVTYGVILWFNNNRKIISQWSLND